MKLLAYSLTLSLAATPALAAGPKYYHQATTPATCTVGDLWIDTDATAGNQISTCTAANTWTKNQSLVGDCTVGPCLDGSADGGNLIKLWAGTGSYWTALQGGSPAANRSWRLPIAAAPAAGETLVMTMDEYGQMGFLAAPETSGYVLASTDGGVLSWAAGGSGAGDDLGSAAYSDVVALWATCTGYLKSDGTCDTPSGSATYPSAAGVANWGGSAWGTSYTVGMAANNLVQLNSSAQLPAVSAALLTNFPTLNQNTTGTAGGLSGQYIDWSAPSGGTSIANKPILGAAAALDYGTDIGDVVRLADDGGGNAALPFTISYTDLADQPTIPADVGDLTDTGGLLGGSVDSLDDLSDVTLGTPSSGQVLKFNGSVWAAAADSTAEGAGYVSTPPTYSDEACTPGQYAFSTTTGYVCVSSGDWNTFSLTDWNNPTPDTTPASFSFVDQTDVATSTVITSAPVQITGINAATAVSASGGTAGICTSTDIGDCGTFGTNPGNITNEQYVRARHTSSASAETAVNTSVTVGGVSDTFTSTTAAGTSADTLYDARVIFADGGQYGSAFKICVYDASASNTLVECSSPGTIVNNSTQTATFSGTESLSSGRSYVIGVVCNGGCNVSKASDGSVNYDGSGSYAAPPSTFSGTWTGSGTLSLEARNSSGTNLIGSIGSPSLSQNLTGDYVYGSNADAY